MIDRLLPILLLFALSGSSVQAQNAPVTSIFAEPLSRKSVGPVKNVDPNSINRIRQAEDGHLVVTGEVADIVCPPHTFVELKPRMAIPGFNPVTLNVLVDGMPLPTPDGTRGFGLEHTSGTPVIRIDPPTGQINRKQVQVLLYDGSRAARRVMEATVRSRVAEGSPTLSVLVHPETIDVSLGGEMLADLFLNDVYLGKTLDAGKPATIDVRRLAPGSYTLAVYPYTGSGVVMAPLKHPFSIAPRYSLSVEHEGPFHYGLPLDPDSIDFRVSLQNRSSIVKTRVYVNGELMGEANKSEFIAKVPVRNIPSGKTTLDVMGIAADGTRFPLESYPIEVKNDVWESDTYSTPDYAEIRNKQQEVKQYNAEMEKWYGLLSQEPWSKFAKTEYRSGWGNYTDAYGQSYRGWLYYFRDIYVPTNALTYKRNADFYTQKLAKTYLEMGTRYASLKMRQQARTVLLNVIALLGNDSPEGKLATTKLHDLTILEE